MIQIRCRCGRSLEIPAEHLGRSGRCPACRTGVRVLAPGTETASQGPLGCLLAVSGPMDAGTQYFLAGPGPITFGKAPGQDIRLGDGQASRRHGQFARQDNGWRVEDLGSTNGVFVNDQRIQKHSLTDGDFLRIGGCEFKYVEPEPAGTAPTPPGRSPASKAPSAKAEPVANPPTAENRSQEEDDDLLPFADDDGTFELATIEDEGGPTVHIQPDVEDEEIPADGPVCASCGKQFPAKARICVDCGIDLRTGRAVLISMEGDLDSIAEMAETLVHGISWFIPLGIYPIASTAFGTSKPWVIRSLAILTTVVSLWFLAATYWNWGDPGEFKNLMLWGGTLNRQTLAEAGAPVDEMDLDELKRQVHERLDPGEYRSYQLVTHAFLHAGLLHLAGNMLFLMVLGSRVNALLGNIATAALYPVLAIGAALFQLAATQDELPHAMIGASGAVMGLAGMYFVFFPIHRMYMVSWWRLGLLFRFELRQWLFTWPGWVVVLFYIAFDVFATLMNADDGVAHWAHLGGFIVGAALALVFLLTGLVDARGGDLISAVLGRHARLILRRRQTAAE